MQPYQTRRANNARVSEALGDHCILAEIETVIRQHIFAGLLEASALSHDLTMTDPDEVMKQLWEAFAADGVIGDAMSDALHEFRAQIADAGGEPLTAPRATAPSKPAYTMNAHVNPLFAHIINSTVKGP